MDETRVGTCHISCTVEIEQNMPHFPMMTCEGNVVFTCHTDILQECFVGNSTFGPVLSCDVADL